MHDFIVIGAGLGGLTTAALLARDGAEVLLLEAHTVPGGCASYFSRQKFLFDAGATTLSGLQAGQPVSTLCSRLGLELPIRSCDPGMIIHHSGALIRRFAALESWIAECERVFGPAGQHMFWSRIARRAERGWDASLHAGRALPITIRNLPRVVQPGMIRHARLLPSLFRSVADEIRSAGLGDHHGFREFLAEQLMITTQSAPGDTPLLVGAMGLQYPADTWYVDGGMNALPRALLRAYRKAGGHFVPGARVVDMKKDDAFTVRTETGGVYRGRRVVSNLPVWDTARIAGRQLDGLRLKYAAIACRGAVTYYAGVEDTFDDHGSCYHQILLDQPMAFGGGKSLFVSLSHNDDRGRAPAGFRTVTVSTHVEDVSCWLSVDGDEYQRRKDHVAQEVERQLSIAFPGFHGARKPVRSAGTPRTFITYTGRHRGWVGGIPHSLRRPLYSWQGHRTSIAGLHLVGDTVYPGQGAPAVILGAMHLVDDLGRGS